MSPRYQKLYHFLATVCHSANSIGGRCFRIMALLSLRSYLSLETFLVIMLPSAPSSAYIAFKPGVGRFVRHWMLRKDDHLQGAKALLRRKLSQYLVLLLLIPRHVIVHVSACTLNGQDAIADGRDHVQLLNDRVHVTGGTGILQTYKAFVGPWPHWRQVLPLCQCFTTWNEREGKTFSCIL